MLTAIKNPAAIRRIGNRNDPITIMVIFVASVVAAPVVIVVVADGASALLVLQQLWKTETSSTHSIANKEPIFGEDLLLSRLLINVSVMSLTRVRGDRCQFTTAAKP